MQLLNVEGTLFGGAARGDADISLAKNDEHYKANIAVDRINFPRLTDLYFEYKTAQGELAGSLQFRRRRRRAHKMRRQRAKCRFRTATSSPFRFSVRSPICSRQSFPAPATASRMKRPRRFKIDDGVIHTDDFKVAGKLFGMLGHGELDFLDDKLDFDIRIDANGPGACSRRSIQLFEYKGDGSLRSRSGIRRISDGRTTLCSARTCRSAAACIARSSAPARSSARRCRFS